MKFFAAIATAAALKMKHKHQAHAKQMEDPFMNDECNMMYWDSQMALWGEVDADQSGDITLDEALAAGLPMEVIEFVGQFDADDSQTIDFFEAEEAIISALIMYEGCE